MTYNGGVACFLWTAATSASEVKISWLNRNMMNVTGTTRVASSQNMTRMEKI